MWPDQFELRSGLNTMATVGRTSETSAISIRPVRNGKNRRRATTCLAVSAGAPVRLSPRLTSSKLTRPVGNRDTDAPPRSTGSSPVTARISALTASRTVSAGIRNGRIKTVPNPATSTAMTASPRRLMPTGVTTRFSRVFAGSDGGCSGGKCGYAARSPGGTLCKCSVTLSWPPLAGNPRNSSVFLRGATAGRLEQGLSIGQRMRRGCGVSFHQLRTNRRPSPILLSAGSGRRPPPQDLTRAAQQTTWYGCRTYSITSSAVASRVGGTVRPSILAVSALMTSSNLLDCTTGRSAGLSPLRMRPA